MRSIFHYSAISLLWLFIAGGCKKVDDQSGSKPVITIGEKYTNIEGLNEGDQLRIPVEVHSPLGIKRLAWYLITKTANGTSAGDPVAVDRTDAPTNLTDTIRLTVTDNFLELVVIAFDVQHNNSEIHIATDNIRSVQAIQFKDDVTHRESVFEGKKLLIEGKVISEFDLSAISYQTIRQGTVSAATAVAITDKRNAPFAINVSVTTGLSGIIINTENVHGAVVKDTFTIGRVQDDAVVISLASNSTTIEKMYTTVNNTVSGNVFSGTAITGLTYALKKGGVYGNEITLPVGNPADEFPFSFNFMGENGIEAVRITGINAGGKKAEAEFRVAKVYRPLKLFKNIVLTTEIGSGKNNFFSAYQAPHVFSIDNAAAYDEMIDLGFFKYSASSNNIMPPAVFTAGTAYASAVAPYMTGFDKAPYTLVTANRPSVNNTSFDTLQWDTQLMEHVAAKVAAPVAQGGENYNIYGTNRRTNNVFNVGQGFYIGWGQWDPINNQSFGLVIVRDYQVNGAYATITLDIKVPEENQRIKYNPVSLFNYP
ncbi:hypothetical protein [Longitalea luteola]|uniref:hypothetical protein n=1 Tax=Longitalea luteola TaxID=2812563 RepID=UPI001A976501|nr:hypothetical protein [Longitalea luteola]